MSGPPPGPRLESPRSWRRSTRRLFILLFPVALPAWLGVMFARNGLIALSRAALYVWKFCADPPRRRIGYHERTSARVSGRSTALILRRGRGERFFDY